MTLRARRGACCGFCRSGVIALHSNPLYIHQHSKQSLVAAVNSDTKFLADLNVIDYSLLVGVDSVTNELVIGLVGASSCVGWAGVAGTGATLILTDVTSCRTFALLPFKRLDYIRTYTWDKKLESWVKETGLLGGGGKEPTISSPKQYRLRFKEAMDRYFHVVSD